MSDDPGSRNRIRPVLPAGVGLPRRPSPPPPGPPAGVRLVKPSDFTLMATDFVGGLHSIDGNVRTAIAVGGDVVFVGTQPPVGSDPPRQAVFVGGGAGLSVLPTRDLGYFNVRAVRLASSGAVLFVGEKDKRRGLHRGVPGSSSIATLLDGAVEWALDPASTSPPVQPRIGLSSNDIVAFSTIESGKGALYRSTLAGPPTVLRAASGAFYNNQTLDVNASGVVAVQMEYYDPDGGLQRGILHFSTANQSLGSTDTTVERQSVGVQPEFALNDAGKVAFALNAPITIQYFQSGKPTTVLTVPAGVHLATPSPFGTPFAFATVATPASGYSHFGKVSLSASGRVVFEASLNGNRGVFFGGDPATDTIAITGEEIVLAGARHFFSIVRLGDVNAANQLAIQTSDFHTTDQKIWRIQLPPG